MTPINWKLFSDPTHSAIATTVDSIADAVTHARFVGSDQASDGVVLMKIVQVLRTLMLSPEGSALTNESVCEVMLSCFRICFEPRLNELLRRAAEHALKDIILLLFMRLPQFTEERHANGLIKKLKMMASGGGIETSTGKRRRTSKTASKSSTQNCIKSKDVLTTPAIRCPDIDDGDAPKSPMITENVLSQTATPNQALLNVQKSILATTPSTPLVGNIVDMQGKFMQTPHVDSDEKCETNISDSKSDNNDGIASAATVSIDENAENDADVEDDAGDDANQKTSIAVHTETKDEYASTNPNANPIAKGEDFVNSMGVRFTPQTENGAFRSTLHKFHFLFILVGCCCFYLCPFVSMSLT